MQELEKKHNRAIWNGEKKTTENALQEETLQENS